MRLRVLLMAGGVLAGAVACAPAPSPDENGSAAAWRCDADDARSLIGSHVGAVTFPAEANIRMACTTCAVTEDYQEDRLTLYFEEETGIVERVACG